LVGPSPGVRVATLVPQAEVTALLMIGVPLWACAFRAERFDAFRRALAATARGPARAVVRAVAGEGRTVAVALGAGLVVWLVAGALPGGPSLRDVLGCRLLLLAFAAFGIGLGAWASVVWRGRPVARAVGLGVVVLMAAAPLAVAPVIAVAGARAWLIHATMLLCPWIVTAGASGLDLLRMEWVYAFSPLGSVEAPYPGLLVAVATYASAGVLMLELARRALGRRRAGDVA
jgi:hypothetical protein